MRVRIITSSYSISIKLVNFIIFIYKKTSYKKKKRKIIELAFIHSFNSYLLPGTVLDTEHMAVNKTDLMIMVFTMLRYRDRYRRV